MRLCVVTKESLGKKKVTARLTLPEARVLSKTVTYTDMNSHTEAAKQLLDDYLPRIGYSLTSGVIEEGVLAHMVDLVDLK